MERREFNRIFAVLFQFSCLVIITVPDVNAGLGKGYRVNTNQLNAELVLIFPSPPKYRTRSTKQGLVLNFDNKDIGSIDLSSALTELSSWVQTMWASYDSLLLKPRSGIEVSFHIRGSKLHIYFYLGTSINENLSTVTLDSVLALNRVKTLLILESGRPTEARQRIKDLMLYSPGNVLLMLDLARVEERLNRWREALSLYEQAQQLKPSSTDITDARKRLLNTYGSRITVGTKYAEIGDTSTQKIVHLKVRKLTDSKMTMSMEYDRFDAEEEVDVQRINGEAKPFKVVRNRIAVEMETPFRKGVQRFSLFGGAKKLGAGWVYSQTNDYGLIQADVDWNRPWFESAEAIVGYGYRDRLMFSSNQTFGNQLSTHGKLSFNRYGLEDIDTAAKSHRMKIGTRYSFQPTSGGFSIGYELNSENVVYRAKRIDDLGNQFFPLALDSTEQHVVDIGWYKKFKNRLIIDSQLGYEYDRKRDSNAPFGRFHLRINPKPKFEWDMGIQTGLSSYRDRDENFFRISSNLTWLF